MTDVLGEKKLERRSRKVLLRVPRGRRKKITQKVWNMLANTERGKWVNANTEKLVKVGVPGDSKFPAYVVGRERLDGLSFG